MGWPLFSSQPFCAFSEMTASIVVSIDLRCSLVACKRKHEWHWRAVVIALTGRLFLCLSVANRLEFRGSRRYALEDFAF
jgi:hypothetical protein